MYLDKTKLLFIQPPRHEFSNSVYYHTTYFSVSNNEHTQRNIKLLASNLNTNLRDNLKLQVHWIWEPLTGKIMESWANINVWQRSTLQYWLKHILNCRFIAAAFVISATVTYCATQRQTLPCWNWSDVDGGHEKYIQSFSCETVKGRDYFWVLCVGGKTILR